MKEKRIIVNNDISELGRIAGELEILGEEWELPTKVIFNVNIAIEELITNTIFYAYSDENIHPISISFSLQKDMLKIVIEDDGMEFNPLLSDSPEDLDKPAEERKIGGLGIHFVKTLMDGVEYQRYDNRNMLTLIKKI